MSSERNRHFKKLFKSSRHSKKKLALPNFFVDLIGLSTYHPLSVNPKNLPREKRKQPTIPGGERRRDLMPKPSRCIVEGCPNPSQAKGYCRRHYGQIWRRGMIYNETPRESLDPSASHLKRDDQERLLALERELRRAQQMYNVVVGFQGRIKWRRE